MNRAREGREATDFVRILPSPHHSTELTSRRQKTSDLKSIPSSALAGLKLAPI